MITYNYVFNDNQKNENIRNCKEDKQRNNEKYTKMWTKNDHKKYNK
jgi:hypothetical protein